MKQLFLLSFTFFSFTQLYAQKTAKEIYKKSTPAVVMLGSFDESGKLLSTGSGFIVRANGVVVTNFHVIEGAKYVQVKLQDGDMYPVKGIIEYDKIKDFAILKIAAVNLPILPLANSDLAETGDHVIAIGNPKGLEHTLSEGIISRIQKMEGYKMIQTTAPISPGSSGGGLFNMAGEIIAITTGYRDDGQNLNFALPINYVSGNLEDTNIKYSLIPAAELVTEAPKPENKETDKAANEDVSIEHFLTTYEDTHGYFSTVYPKTWKTDSFDGWNKDKTVYWKEFMAAPAEAEKAILDGYLSEGIRVTYKFPKDGNKQTPKIYNTDFMNALANANHGFKITKSEYTTLTNGKEALMFAMEGKNDNTSEPEISIDMVVTNEQYSMHLEMVCPQSKAIHYSELYTTILDRFRLKK